MTLRERLERLNLGSTLGVYIKVQLSITFMLIELAWILSVITAFSYLWGTSHSTGTNMMNIVDALVLTGIALGIATIWPVTIGMVWSERIRERVGWPW